MRPVPRPAPADPSCAGLAASVPGAAWSEQRARLAIGPGGRLAVGDASVYGGPFEPPLSTPVPPGEYAIRVLLGPSAAGPARPLCAELRLAEGAVTSFRPLGEVSVDTDVVALVDEARYLALVREAGAPRAPGVEAPADVLPSLVAELRGEGVPLEQALTTAAYGTRPEKPGDRATVSAALLRMKAPGRYQPEPLSPAWPLYRALAAAPFAELDAPSGPRVAVAIETSRGDGAYRVAVGEGDGAARTIEVRLYP